MPYNITRILLISALTQGLAWTACATETRPGFYNAEEDDDDRSSLSTLLIEKQIQIVPLRKIG